MRKKRALVFVDDPYILELLEEILLLRGFEVVAFRKPVVCPLYDEKLNNCKNMLPCADVLIVDRDLAGMDGVSLLLKQYERGCRMDIRNKAVIASYVNPDEKLLIDYIGFKLLKKPFDLKVVSEWLDGCEQRMNLESMVGIMRHHDRHSTDIRIVYEVMPDGKSCEGIVTNISNRGLCLTTHAPIARKNHVLVKTPLPNLCRKAIVRWVIETNSASFAAGLLCYLFL